MEQKWDVLYGALGCHNFNYIKYIHIYMHT